MSTQNTVILATAIVLAIGLSSCDGQEGRFGPLSGPSDLKTTGATPQERTLS
jgi:hypothetical protein